MAGTGAEREHPTCCDGRLRQHLEDDPKAPKLIRTVRNQGYMLTAEDVVSA